MSEEPETSQRSQSQESLLQENSAIVRVSEGRRLSRAQRRRELALRMGIDESELSWTQKLPGFLRRNPEETESKPVSVPKLPLLVALMVLLPSSAAVIAIALLLRLPSVPDCPNVFWPTASASLRLYCAELTANKDTLEDLLKAIALVNELPQDHPLRADINHKIGNWSQAILKLGEGAFQEGKIAEALALADKIPNNVPVYDQVQKQTKEWKSIWDDADKIYRTAEDWLRQEKWTNAFHETTKLLDVPNNYWATTKYNELTNRIQGARNDGNKLAKARTVGEDGSLDNLLKAIKLLEAIQPNSYLHEAAMKEIKNFANKILDIAYGRVQAGKWQEGLEIASKIPESAQLNEEVDDLGMMARTTSQITPNNVKSLEGAIALLKKLPENRPLYTKAQDLVNRWQEEVADIKTLESARRLAQGGGLNELRGAIQQLQTIPSSNPRGKEAQGELTKWTRQLELLEDQPYLQRADQLALGGNTVALEAAIREVRKIGSGRSLYQEAQNRIQSWTEKSQKMQDQPYLDQAVQLANNGNYDSAISAAQRITPGRFFYAEARQKIEKWEALLSSEQNLKNARQAASGGTPDALESAIMLASKVPVSSSLRWKADDAINEWSQQLLTLALQQSDGNLQNAIGILQKIPPGSSAYAQAQSKLQSWQASLNPPPVEKPRKEERIEAAPATTNTPNTSNSSNTSNSPNSSL